MLQKSIGPHPPISSFLSFLVDFFKKELEDKSVGAEPDALSVNCPQRIDTNDAGIFLISSNFTIAILQLLGTLYVWFTIFYFVLMGSGHTRLSDPGMSK